jgi:predicted DNA-binding transcriptional regulator AlpA
MKGKQMDSKIERLLRPDAVYALVGMGDTWIRKLTDEGKFPKPLYIGTGKVKRRAYRELEIAAWIADRIAERDAQREAA